MYKEPEESIKNKELLRRPFEILNERPADMPYEEYRELRKIQKKMLKLTGSGKFVVEVAANRMKLLKAIGRSPSRHNSIYCKAYTKRHPLKYVKRFALDLNGKQFELAHYLRNRSNFAIKCAWNVGQVTKIINTNN